MRLLVLLVFIEGEDIVDVVDQGLHGNCSEGGSFRPREVLEVPLLQELLVVYEEPVELRKVLILCHLIFIIT